MSSVYTLPLRILSFQKAITLSCLQEVGYGVESPPKIVLSQYQKCLSARDSLTTS